MSIIRITAHIYVETGDRDPEEVASQMNSGLAEAVGHFPHGEVIDAEVCTASALTGEEITEKGFDE
jgi:hypothetical protein